MRLKYLAWFFAAISLPILAPTCVSQVVPSANSGGGQSFTVGIGPSSYDVDWGHGRMLGGTIWADWYPRQLPQILQGLGLEAEVRDISLDRSSSQPSNFRQDTAGGGLIYSWPHYPRFRPYIKTLFEFGSMDFKVQTIPGYTHDTRTLYAPGGGIDYRVYGPIWARADYEYQFWETLLGHTPDPQGFTVGVAYRFGSGMRH